MIITREKGMRMWGGGSGSTSASGVNGGGGFSLTVAEGEGTGNAYTDFTYESGTLTLNKATEFVTVDFFNKLFTAYDANGTAIVPNDTTTAINNLKLMVGTWTEQYLSALGLNSEGGGGGGGIELSDVWQSLKTNTDDYANQKINSAHIPDLSGTYATKTWVNQQGFVTSSGVTSVAMTVPTGLSVSGTPITTTGTLALTFASGYSIPTTAKQGNWDTAYGWGNHASAGYAMGTTKIIAGNGLTGGGTLAADRTLSVQLQSNSGLAVSSSGLKLDIINNLTTESAYKAISATQAKKIWDLLNQMFTLEGAGTTASPYVIKANYGLYTEQFLSALGQNSSGGGSGDFDEAQMWTALQSTSGTYATTKIATSHIPDMASTYGYLKSSALSGYATQAWVNQQGFLTTHQSIYALTLKTGGTAVTTFTPNSADASLDFVAGTNISLTRGTNQITIANTYSYTLPLAASGTRGGVQIGYSESNSGTSTTRNYAVKLSSEKMYVNVPWTDTTYKLTLNGTTNGASGGTSLGSFYAPTAVGTDGYVLKSSGSGAPSWVAQSTLSVGTAAKLNTGTTTYTAWGQTYWSSGVPQSVSGDMTGVDNIYMANAKNIIFKDSNGNNIGVLGLVTSNNLHIGYNLAENGYSTYIQGYNIYLRYGANRTAGISLASTGAVTIAGAATLSSTLSVAGGITLTTTKKIYFGDTSHYLELNSTGFHFSHGIYSDSFVSALGANSSGGGSGTFDEEAMWKALGTTSTAKVIASSHIPNLSASKITSGTLAAARIPVATASAVGGIKVGTTLAISDGVLNQKSGIATAGTYRSVTVDTYGRVTAGTNPTTLSGYGITNAYTKTQVDNALGGYLPLSGGTMTGTLTTPKIRINTRHSSDNTSGGIYYYDGTTDYLLIGQGSANLWIGANETVGTHHTGSTYISAGGGSAYISRLVDDARNNYIILDAGNYTSYTVTKTGTGASGTWGISVSGNSASTTALKNLYDSSTRPTSANLTHITNGGVQHFKATGSMTTGKPVSDAHILHFHWDGEAYDAQMAITTAATPTIQYRTHSTSGNTFVWGSWITALTSSNYSSYALPLSGGTITGNLSVKGYIYLRDNNKCLYTADTANNVQNTLVLDGNNHLLIGYGTAGSGYNTYLHGNSLYLRYGTSRATGLSLGSTGLVSISKDLTVGGEVTASSDARKKNIISNTKFNVRDIASARSIIYEWNDDRDKDNEKKIHGGSIAQDWLGKADSFLSQDNDGWYSINYGALALCSAITIAREVVKHEDRIAILEKENARLKARVEELEERRAL